MQGWGVRALGGSLSLSTVVKFKRWWSMLDKYGKRYFLLITLSLVIVIK